MKYIPNIFIIYTYQISPNFKLLIVILEIELFKSLNFQLLVLKAENCIQHMSCVTFTRFEVILSHNFFYYLVPFKSFFTKFIPLKIVLLHKLSLISFKFILKKKI